MDLFAYVVADETLNGLLYEYRQRLYYLTKTEAFLLYEDFGLPIKGTEHYVLLTKETKQTVHVLTYGTGEKLIVPRTDYGFVASKLGYPHMIGTDVDLKILYNRFNEEYFDNQLPTDVQIEWTNRLSRAAGNHTYKRNGRNSYHHIKISEGYIATNPDQLDDIIVHEMIHVMLPYDSHNHNFQREMHRINEMDPTRKITLTAEGNLARMKRHVYTCPTCYERYFQKSKVTHRKPLCPNCFRQDEHTYLDYQGYQEVN